MLFVVQAQAANGPDILAGQWSEEHPHIRDLVGDSVLCKDISLDDSGLGNLCDVVDPGREYRIAIVNLAILSQEADQTLR